MKMNSGSFIFFFFIFFFIHALSNKKNNNKRRQVKIKPELTWFLRSQTNPRWGTKTSSHLDYTQKRRSKWLDFFLSTVKGCWIDFDLILLCFFLFCKFSLFFFVQWIIKQIALRWLKVNKANLGDTNANWTKAWDEKKMFRKRAKRGKVETEIVDRQKLTNLLSN